MKHRPDMLEGVGVALLISLAGAAAFTFFSTLFGVGFFRVVIAMLAFVYVLYLLFRSQHRTGRISVVVLWTMAALLNLFMMPSLPLYLLTHLLLIWLIRALYYYHGVVPALLDLGLIGIASLAAEWAWLSTHSLFMSLWCFFLSQALFVLIPSRITKKRKRPAQLHQPDDAFETAYRNAELAVRKLTTPR